MKKFKSVTLKILILSLCLVLLFLLSFNQLFDVINARAVQYSRSYATEVINRAVREVLDETVTDGEAFVRLNADSDGNVLSLSIDTSEVNRFKSLVSLKILQILSDNGKKTLRMPIGNLTGMYVLSGRGFDLSIRLIPTDGVLTSVESAFGGMGINQSRHTLTLKVTVKLGVILLGEHTSVEVKDNIIISDTVIVGRVPDAYTNIEKADSETVGDIVDFKAG